MGSTHGDDARKIAALTALAENYGKTFSVPLLDLWLNLLAQFNTQQVHDAVAAVIERYEYKTLPPFAVLKQALDELDGVGEKALSLMALAEWGALLAAIAEHGSYNRPSLHPTTAHVVQLLGGWSAACQWTQVEADFRRREFLRFWVDAHGRVEILQRGATSVQQALTGSRAQRSGPVAVGQTVGMALEALETLAGGEAGR